MRDAVVATEKDVRVSDVPRHSDCCFKSLPGMIRWRIVHQIGSLPPPQPLCLVTCVAHQPNRIGRSGNRHASDRGKIYIPSLQHPFVLKPASFLHNSGDLPRHHRHPRLSRKDTYRDNICLLRCAFSVVSLCGISASASYIRREVAQLQTSSTRHSFHWRFRNPLSDPSLPEGTFVLYVTSSNAMRHIQFCLVYSSVVYLCVYLTELTHLTVVMLDGLVRSC